MFKLKKGEIVTTARGEFRHESKEFDIWPLGPKFHIEKQKGNRHERGSFNDLLAFVINAKPGKDEFSITYRPIWETRRYASYKRYSADHTDEILAGVKAFKKVVAGHGVRTYVEVGNDAPRGGMLGKYIRVVVRLPKQGKEDK